MGEHSATAGIGRRLLSLIYEVLLLSAIVLLAGGIAAAIAQVTDPAQARLFTQAVAFPACAAYFAWQWHRGGQTLPMKTWRMRLETTEGGQVALSRALLRVALAVPGYLLIGITIIWVLIDRDKQFLHDRLSGTRLVNAA